MIDASLVRRMQSQWAGELHMKLCAKIEQAVVNAAADSRTELLVQLHTAMQLSPLFDCIRLTIDASSMVCTPV